MILPLVTEGRAASRRRGPILRSEAQEEAAVAIRLSQYYTRTDVAIRLYAVFRRLFDPSRFVLVEPSAGTGSFYMLLPPGSRAFDVDPKLSGIEAADFLTVRIGGSDPIAFIGNPPFSNGMAIRFFNHAAFEADVIAFILPRSFRKDAVQNKLDRDFHLMHEEDVERDAFVFRSRPTHVPSVFQVWIRRGVKRELHAAPIEHDDFYFVTLPRLADFAVQRVGTQAGRVHDDLELSRQAHYLIRAKRPGVRAIMEKLDFGSVTRDVAAKPSLAKTELVSLYQQYVDRYGHAASSATPRSATCA